MATSTERLVAAIEVNAANALAELAKINAALDKTARDREAKVNVDTKGAHKNVSLLAGASKSLDFILAGLGKTMAGVKFGALYAGATLLAPALAAVTAAAGGAVAALGNLAGLVPILGAGFVTLGAGIGAAVLGFKGIGAAVKAYAGVQESMAAAHSQVASAARAVSSAERGVATARKAVSKATSELLAAEKDIAQARKDAAETLVTQREDAVLAGFAQTEAVLALQDAQEKLRRAQEKTAAGANTLRKETDDFTGKVYEISIQSSNTTADDIAAAKRDVTRAEIGVARAKLDNKHAQDALNDSEKKGIEGSDRVQSAIQKRADAQDNLRDANDRVKDSLDRLAEADQRLIEAQKGGSAASKAYATAMANLTPAGRSFVNFLINELKPAWKKVTDQFQIGLLDGGQVENGFREIMKLFPLIGAEGRKMAHTVGKAFEDWGKFLGSPEMRGPLTEMFTGMNKALDAMMALGKPLTRIFVAVMNAALPFVTLLTNDIVKGLTGMADRLDSVVGKKKFQDFLQRAYDFTKLWWKVLAPLAGVLGGVVRAATPLATWMLEGMAKSLTKMSDSVNSLTGQDKMKAWFEGQKPVIRELMGLFGDFIKIFFDPKIENSGLVNTLKTLREKFIPALSDLIVNLSKSNFGSAFATFLSHIVDGISALVGRADSPLTLLVQGVNKLADGLGWLSRVTGGKSTTGILAVLTGLSVLKGFKIAKGALDGLKGMLGLGGKANQAKGLTPANPMYVWVVNSAGGAGGLPTPGGKPGKVKTIAKGAANFAKKLVPVGLGVAGTAGALTAATAAVAIADAALIAKDVSLWKEIQRNKKELKNSQQRGDRAGQQLEIAKLAKSFGISIQNDPAYASLRKKVGEDIAKGVTSAQWSKDIGALRDYVGKHDSYMNHLAQVSGQAGAKGAKDFTGLMTQGLNAGKPGVQKKSSEIADLPSKAQIAKNRANFLASQGSGLQIISGLNSKILPFGVTARQLAAVPHGAMTAQDYRPDGRRVVTSITEGVKDPKARTGLMGALTSLGTTLANFFKGLFSKGGPLDNARNSVTSFVSGLFGRGDGPGPSSGGAGGRDGTKANGAPGGQWGYASTMAKTTISKFPGSRITSGYRTPAQNKAAGGSPTSYHLDRLNPAQDLGGSNLQGMFQYIYDHYGKNVRELIYGAQMVKNGQIVPYTKGDHWDHVHVAHKGGDVGKNWPKMAGLKRDERPAILQVGEKVIPKGLNNNPGLSDAQLERVLQKVMAAAKAPVHIENTFNEKVDPMLLSSELAWRVA